MKRLVRVLVFAILVSWLSQAPMAAAGSNWSAKYWDNTNLAGNPVLQRTEDDIDHDWGTGGPGTLTDNFSARWTQTTYLGTAVYRFTATMDDGMRVWVNDTLIIDSWYDSQSHTVAADIFLAAGNHNIKVEYYEVGGSAVAKLNWTAISGSTALWHGEYFNNTSLSGSPVMIRDDATINFNWSGSPGGGVWADQFSVRWTGTISLDPGTYRFSVTTDDGVRLWVNNQLLIDQWREQAAATNEVEVTLPGGETAVRMEYFDHGGLAVASLNWVKVAAPAPPPAIPSIIHWRGEYFNNRELAGTPVLVRDDEGLNFIWGSSSPQPNVVNPDHFSVRWSQTVNLTPGSYTFTAYADDGVRVWVNNQLVIDSWQIQDVQPHSGVITLPGGPTTIVMTYFEYTGLAEARLQWADSATTPGVPSTPAAPVPPPITGGVPSTATMSGAQYLTVRSGPSLDGEPVTYLSRGQAVTLLTRDPFTIWIQVRLADGTSGWVSGRFLTPNAPLGNLPINYAP